MFETYQLLLHVDGGELLGGNIRAGEKVMPKKYNSPPRKDDRYKERSKKLFKRQKIYLIPMMCLYCGILTTVFGW